MNRSKAFLFFVLFLVCFYASLTLKFLYFVVGHDQSVWAWVGVSLCAFTSTVFLAGCVRALNTERSKTAAFLEGAGFFAIAFLLVNISESMLSDRAYLKGNHPQDFSVLSGHCGVHSGRTLLKLLHMESSEPGEGAFQEFKIQQRCRMSHLGYLMQNKNQTCEPGEDGIECQIRWMSGIAEHGYWSRYTRQFFFDQVMKLWPESKKEEALVNYALKDQELELGRQSIVKQAGIEDSFSERYLMIQEKEELDNLKLTQNIFNVIAGVLSDVNVNPQPYLFKFKDMQAQVDEKLAKIPELEKEMAPIKSETKYNLSQ